MKPRTAFPALAALALGAAPAAAQIALERVPRRTVDTSLQHYGQTVARETAALRAAGFGRDWNRIQPLVARYLPPQDYPNFPGASQSLLRGYHVASTTNFIVRIGYRARHLAHPGQARTIIGAANIRSWDEADALVLVSPTVFVADLVRIERSPDNSADLVYRVREPIKGSRPTGSEFRYPLNGPFPTIAGRPGDPPPPPPPPNPGAWELAGAKSALFFGSAPGAIGNFFGPMPIDGERVRPAYHSMTRETTLVAIRAAARAQLCSPGYIPAAPGVSLPGGC